jgi:hypothetical protein
MAASIVAPVTVRSALTCKRVLLTHYSFSVFALLRRALDFLFEQVHN